MGDFILSEVHSAPVGGIDPQADPEAAEGIKQLQRSFPPPPTAAAPSPAPSHQSKKTNPLLDPQGAARF